MRQRGGSVEKIEEEVAGHLNLFIFGRRLKTGFNRILPLNRISKWREADTHLCVVSFGLISP